MHRVLEGAGTREEEGPVRRARESRGVWGFGVIRELELEEILELPVGWRGIKEAILGCHSERIRDTATVFFYYCSKKKA